MCVFIHSSFGPTLLVYLLSCVAALAPPSLSTCLHALSQHADTCNLLGIDNLVAVDEGQVRFGRHIRLAAETLKILHTFLCHHILQGQRSYDQSDKTHMNSNMMKRDLKFIPHKHLAYVIYLHHKMDWSSMSCSVMILHTDRTKDHTVIYNIFFLPK